MPTARHVPKRSNRICRLRGVTATNSAHVRGIARASELNLQPTHQAQCHEHLGTARRGHNASSC
eukprot:4908329-Alexandrium_andersonii.AAC.1